MHTTVPAAEGPAARSADDDADDRRDPVSQRIVCGDVGPGLGAAVVQTWGLQDVFAGVAHQVPKFQA